MRIFETFGRMKCCLGLVLAAVLLAAGVFGGACAEKTVPETLVLTCPDTAMSNEAILFSCSGIPDRAEQCMITIRNTVTGKDYSGLDLSCGDYVKDGRLEVTHAVNAPDEEYAVYVGAYANGEMIARSPEVKLTLECVGKLPPVELKGPKSVTAGEEAVFTWNNSGHDTDYWLTVVGTDPDGEDQTLFYSDGDASQLKLKMACPAGEYCVQLTRKVEQGWFGEDRSNDIRFTVLPGDTEYTAFAIEEAVSETLILTCPDTAMSNEVITFSCSGIPDKAEKCTLCAENADTGEIRLFGNITCEDFVDNGVLEWTDTINMPAGRYTVSVAAAAGNRDIIAQSNAVEIILTCLGELEPLVLNGPESITAGGEAVFTWNNSGHDTDYWLTVVRTDPDGEGWSTFFPDRDASQLELKMNCPAGEYRARISRTVEEGWFGEERSNDIRFTVLPGDTEVTAFAIEEIVPETIEVTCPAGALSNEYITFSCSGIPDEAEECTLRVKNADTGENCYSMIITCEGFVDNGVLEWTDAVNAPAGRYAVTVEASGGNGNIIAGSNAAEIMLTCLGELEPLVLNGPESVTAGGEAVFTWNNSGHDTDYWLTVVGTDPDGEDRSAGFSVRDASQLRLKMVCPAGEYCARLFKTVEEGWFGEEESNDVRFTVLPGDTEITGFAIEEAENEP